MTPLVDVVLVLLIIFMVITPMLQRGKPWCSLQAKRLPAQEWRHPIMVSVTKAESGGSTSEVKKEDLSTALVEQIADASHFARAGQGRQGLPSTSTSVS